MPAPTTPQIKYQFTLRKLFVWLTLLCVISAFPFVSATLGLMLGAVALVAFVLGLVAAAALGFSFLIASVGVALANRFSDHKK